MKRTPIIDFTVLDHFAHQYPRDLDRYWLNVHTKGVHQRRLSLEQAEAAWMEDEEQFYDSKVDVWYLHTSRGGTYNCCVGTITCMDDAIAIVRALAAIGGAA